MYILVTNDDSINAKGIKALALALSAQHEVVVVAPDAERSGVGHCFTMLTPLTATRVPFEGLEAYRVNGTPVDCVKLGSNNIMKRLPDMIVSGINHGGNLGTDVLYSGTAAAALEGIILGIPSIAISLTDFEGEHFEYAAKFACKAVDYLQKHPLEPLTMLNVNVPNLPEDKILGAKFARLSHKRYNNVYEKRTDPRNRDYYWLPYDAYCDDKPGDVTDSLLISQGYITLTPVKADITDYAQLERSFEQ